MTYPIFHNPSRRKHPRFSVTMPAEMRARFDRIQAEGMDSMLSLTQVVSMAIQLGLPLLENMWLQRPLPELLEPVRQRLVKTDPLDLLTRERPVAAPARNPVEAQPTMSCPKCQHEEPDFDGFGMLHCTACGWCEHASITDGVCSFCGARIPTEEPNGGKSALSSSEFECSHGVRFDARTPCVDCDLFA